MEISKQIREFVDSGRYSDALRTGLEAIVDGNRDPRVMESMFLLAAKLRSTCMDMACRKMDGGPTYLELEILLRRANSITGEDMYGRMT